MRSGEEDAGTTCRSASTLPAGGPLATPERRAASASKARRWASTTPPSATTSSSRPISTRDTPIPTPANSPPESRGERHEQLTHVLPWRRRRPAAAGHLGHGGAAPAGRADREDPLHHRRAVRRARSRSASAPAGCRRNSRRCRRPDFDAARRGDGRIPAGLPRALDPGRAAFRTANTSTSRTSISSRSRCRSRCRSGSAAKAARRCAAPPGWAMAGTRSAPTRLPAGQPGRATARRSSKLRGLVARRGRDPGRLRRSAIGCRNYGREVPAKADDGERRSSPAARGEIADDLARMRELGVAQVDFGFPAATAEERWRDATLSATRCWRRSEHNEARPHPRMQRRQPSDMDLSWKPNASATSCLVRRSLRHAMPSRRSPGCWRAPRASRPAPASCRCRRARRPARR